MNTDTKNRFWTKLPAVIGFTFIACFLWGSAFPCIKIGYRLFGIPAGDSASQMVFAGTRFFIAGLMVIAIASLQKKKFAVPSVPGIPKVLILALLQTAGQYFFFYIGLAHASGVSSSIIEGANTFFCILVAAFIFRSEKINLRKMLGCAVGFLGVVLIQLPGGSVEMHFSLIGEGFVLFSTVLAAFSSSYIKKVGQQEDPMLMSGWQFFAGGLMLAAGGLFAGGRINFAAAGEKQAAAVLLLIYMAFISATAYTIWSMLLKYNPVSRISVFSFINPVIGVLLSALLLGEGGRAFTLTGIAALALVSLGIVIVNRA
uniref:DMT family transporter n=1 Tax=Eubacterium cellulosolvens TaxID=29322 RepID=UPI0009DE809A|nr:DMT family transporter [[Eubacterium] cellulosolvens]